MPTSQHLVQVASTFELEVLQPGANSAIVTHCASIRIRNTSENKVLFIAPQNSAYALPIAPGGAWGIDCTDVRVELRTVLIALIKDHDAPTIVERIFNHSLL
ncbi:hypothetical protein [Hymenobacter cheonanensis]|uniref:hypothetical protein n=1 Tax=Hymenobacter sp. CA2-7 TaxID=3063993 RepID=UPI0027124CA9|nr:hypothetical protein [Hymenobacter sp. CA2-7]MDO7886839.1 hypothetical protein [Hymenobacter sp. CA2-7]